QETGEAILLRGAQPRLGKVASGARSGELIPGLEQNGGALEPPFRALGAVGLQGSQGLEAPRQFHLFCSLAPLGASQKRSPQKYLLRLVMTLPRSDRITGLGLGITEVIQRLRQGEPNSNVSGRLRHQPPIEPGSLLERVSGFVRPSGPEQSLAL